VIAVGVLLTGADDVEYGDLGAAEETQPRSVTTRLLALVLRRVKRGR